MSSVGITTIVDAVQAAVGVALPVAFGKKAARAHNVAPPHVEVYPLGEQFGGAQSAGQTTNPPTLHARRIQTEWHCWGTDYGQAEQIEQAIVTAVRQVMKGANYELGDASWADSANMEMGQVIVVPITFITSLVKAQLPFTGQDDALGTAVVTAIGPDTTGLVPNTGTPYWGETQ